MNSTHQYPKNFYQKPSKKTIEEKLIKMIYHARKSLLFDKDNIWVKKDNPEFNVTMGSNDGTETFKKQKFAILPMTLPYTHAH